MTLTMVLSMTMISKLTHSTASVSHAAVRRVAAPLVRCTSVDGADRLRRRSSRGVSVRAVIVRPPSVTREAEHHAALVVLGDVAVRHPQAGVGDVEEDVDGLAGADEDGVLPHEVVVGFAVAGEHEEPAGAVDVERVVHRVVLVHVVDEADLDPVADLERPVDVPVLLAGVAVDELPDHVAASPTPG